MKEDWLKDIRNRMADYEAEEPRNLWEDICKSMQFSENRRSAYRARRALLWTNRIVAAAVISAVSFAVVHRLVRDNTEMTGIAEQTRPIAGCVADCINEGKIMDETEATVGYNVPFGSIGKISDAGYVITDETDGAVFNYTYVPGDTAQESKEEDKERSCRCFQGECSDKKCITKRMDKKRDKEYSPKASYNIYKDKEGYIPEIAGVEKRRKPGSFSLGLFTNSTTGLSFSRTSIGNEILNKIDHEESEWMDDFLMNEIILHNTGKEVKAKIAHHLPVRVGLSFEYGINEKVSIVSGLIYTKLSATLKEGSSSHYFTGRQTLHYLGIPLSVKYKVCRWGSVGLYCMAGFIAEKCLSGTRKVEYILNSNESKTDSEKITEKPLQWSANVSAGIQYNATPTFGVFVEPGLNYYFNNGSPIKTIYKEKPLSMSLNMGIRLCL